MSFETSVLIRGDNGQMYATMNRRILRMVLFHECPILDRNPSRGALTIQIGGGFGRRVPATPRKLSIHGMLSLPPGPLRFRRECEDRWDRRTTELVHHTYPAGRLRAYTTTLGVNEIACGLVSALNQIHEPQCQLRFTPHLALINVQSFKRSGEPGQVGG
jgi:hypothetical protein